MERVIKKDFEKVEESNKAMSNIFIAIIKTIQFDSPPKIVSHFEFTNIILPVVG